MKTRILQLLILCFFTMTTVSCGLFIKELPNGEVPQPGFHDHFVEINGVKYHYTEYPGSGQNVFLLHGFASSTYSWEKIAPILQAEGCHVWALDMKGFGWSDKPEDGDYSPQQLLEEVNGWMDEVGLSKVVFVGNSLGAPSGIWRHRLEYGAGGFPGHRHPDKVEKLVLMRTRNALYALTAVGKSVSTIIDAAGFMHEAPFAVRLAGLPGASTIAGLFFGRWMIRETIDQVYFDPSLITQAQIDAYYNRMRTRNALYALTAVGKSVSTITSEQYASRIPEIHVDTLIIWGREDAWIPVEDGFQFKKAISKSTLEVIPWCGHIPQEEKPEETARLILEFLAEK